ncbi:hypothetical protein EV182_001459, partial [Spiromyces aspiralis]
MFPVMIRVVRGMRTPLYFVIALTAFTNFILMAVALSNLDFMRPNGSPGAGYTIALAIITCVYTAVQVIIPITKRFRDVHKALAWPRYNRAETLVASAMSVMWISSAVAVSTLGLTYRDHLRNCSAQTSSCRTFIGSLVLSWILFALWALIAFAQVYSSFLNREGGLAHRRLAATTDKHSSRPSGDSANALAFSPGYRVNAYDTSRTMHGGKAEGAAAAGEDGGG